MHSKYYLSEKDEKEIYDRHENSPKDDRYRKFLSRLFIPFIEKIHPNSKGLDFGSGSGPTLSVMLEEVGHSMKIFDKYYFNEPEALHDSYDFITATEVFEHLKRPGVEIERLINLLNPFGFLGVMTKFASDLEHFKDWHYKNDPTHICFYSLKTIDWINNKYGLKSTVFGSDVVIFEKR